MADQIAAQAAPVYYVTGTIHSTETGPGLLYRAPYVAHDNNRDAMGMTLKLTQNVLDTYVGFKAQVLHDLHESGSFLYDNTIGIRGESYRLRHRRQAGLTGPPLHAGGTHPAV